MRKIDADKLRKNMEFICMGILAGTESYDAPLTEIDNAPTIIEESFETKSDYLDKVHKARKKKEAEKLKEAIQLTECISIDYEDADEEEIAQIDDALDIIFRVAREKLKELKKEAEE